MLRTLISLTFIIVFTCNLVQADGRFIPKAQYDKIIRTQYKIKIVGDAVVGERIEKVNTVSKYHTSTIISRMTNPIINIPNELDLITLISFTPTNGQSIYDLQSNGCAVQLWQDPVTPDYIYAVYMASGYNDPSFVNRRSKCYFSFDRGLTWYYIGEVPLVVKSGFVTITGLSDGRALIANHSAAGGGSTRTQVYADVFPGLGSFMRLDPGTGGHSPEPIWPRVVATSSIINTNKFVVLSSSQGDSGFYNIGTSLTEPGTFIGWSGYNATSAENYAIARGEDGRIGIAYVINDVIFPADAGDVYFMESTNDGTTFTIPLKIFDADFSSTGDSLGALRAVSLVYQNSKPKAAFSIIKRDPGLGTYFPLFPNKVMFWSTTLPGADPNRSIVVANQNNVWMPQDSLYQGVNDVLCPFDRPVIGISADKTALFYAFMVISNRYGAPVDSTNFRAVYFTASIDSGASWGRPVRITPISPVMDWTYPSISPISDTDSNYYYINMTIQKDTIPGSFVNGATNGPSLAQQMFVRIKVSRDSIITSKKNISNELPNDYKLFQNYPNPFNPVTNIRLDLPKSCFVALKVFDILGREVTTLVNEKLNAGSYETSWDGSGYPSGVYFYRVSTNDFLSVKKMVIIK